jgi:ATP-dependent exoDNAse (exonuclease V) beta subunit
VSWEPTWSEAARALFELRADTAVSAGAGSGKTTALVELCVRLLSGEATGTPLDPGQVAAITFTEKAAAELVERLRAAVGKRARRAAGGPEAAAWTERLRGLDRMAVGTIHNFCGRLLRERALEAGLDPEFTVLDEAAAPPLLEAAARGAVVAALDAAEPEVTALCAGYGAEGLAGQVAALLRERSVRGLRGAQPVAVGSPEAFTAARSALLAAAAEVVAARAEARTASAGQLVERVARALEALAPDDGTGVMTAAAVARLVALGAAAKPVARGNGMERLKAGATALDAAGQALPGLAAEAWGRPQREALAALVGEAERRYAEGCRAVRGLDFDGLLTATRDLLAGNRTLLAELRVRLRALLVDEYQDVNGVQQAIFELLTAPREGLPDGPIAVAVGDLKQSIYGFRGADVGVFAGLVGRLGGGAGRVLRLTDNHRSAPAVVELVNRLSTAALQPPAGLPPRPFEIAFRPEDRLVASRPVTAAPAAELLEDGAPGSGAERREREAVAVAARIGALVSGRAGLPVMERGADRLERPRRPRFGDVAILFRRTTALSVYERALRAAGVPVRLARGAFHQAPEVRDLGELLTSLTDPGDELAWAALLRSPLCAVSDATLLELAALPLSALPAAGAALLDGLALPEAERRRLDRFLAAWRGLRPLRDRLPPGALLTRAVEALDLDAALAAGPDGERRRRNLEKGLALAARFGERGGTAAELGVRLRWLATQPPREPEADLDDADAVTLLSVHAAKGLEWPIVFLPDLAAPTRSDADRARLDQEGLLCADWYDPSSAGFVRTPSLEAAREEAKRASAAESRRLLYVALTRARDLLVLSGEGRPRQDGTRTFPGWRGLLEEAIAADPALALRIPLADTASAAHGPAVEAPPAATPLPAALATPRLAGPSPPPASRLAVTQLAEYARCPRRHHLTRVLGLVEPTGLHGGATDDDPARATSRGTLAHAMLAELELTAPPLAQRAQLAAVAARRGYDPADPGVVKIRDEMIRFLAAPPGLALVAAAAEGRLRREVPFLLRLDGAGTGAPACYLNGAIDALVAPRPGGRTLVLDFKYALPRAEAAERYRVQLEAYALAASRAIGGGPVEARLQFLRGDFSSLDVTPTAAALAGLAREAPGLALGVARGDGDRPPEALGRDRARCGAEGCGFVERCFGRGDAPDRSPVEGRDAPGAGGGDPS